MQDGFERYATDFRRAIATYYTPDGDSIEIPIHKIDVPVAVVLEGGYSDDLPELVDAFLSAWAC